MTLQRYAFYDSNKTYISGATGSVSLPVISPSNAAYLKTSGDNWNLDTLQIEEGSIVTAYESYYILSDESFPSDIGKGSIVGDNNKKYRMIGANIRTPLTTGDTFKLHNDGGHEPMGITSVTIVDGDLRVAMNFTAKKVITLNVNPHVSMRNAGYEVATTGGLSIHAVSFYKDGVKVNAEDVIINSGSFWISGMFLIE